MVLLMRSQIILASVWVFLRGKDLGVWSLGGRRADLRNLSLNQSAKDGQREIGGILGVALLTSSPRPPNKGRYC